MLDFFPKSNFLNLCATTTRSDYSIEKLRKTKQFTSLTKIKKSVFGNSFTLVFINGFTAEYYKVQLSFAMLVHFFDFIFHDFNLF